MNNDWIATLSCQLFPERNDIIKLLFAKDNVLCDTLSYNKRHYFNSIPISDGKEFSFPVINNNQQLKELRFDDSHQWRQKFVRLLIKEFRNYYLFNDLKYDFIKAIQNHKYVIDMQLNFIEIIRSVILSETLIHRDSDTRLNYNLNELIQSYHPSSYLIADNYRDFIQAKHPDLTVNYFNFSNCLSEEYRYLKIEKQSFLQLFFEYGIFFRKLFRIA